MDIEALLEGPLGLALLLVAAVVGAIGFVAGMVALSYLVYYIVTLPLRRQERARLFLAVVEAGLRRGQSPERTIDAASVLSTGLERALGRRFWDLAVHVTDGLRLGEALEHVPGYLPPAVAGLLAIGERTGDLRKVLPGCRRALADASSRVRGALNYVILLTSGFCVASLNAVSAVMIYVVPRLREMMLDIHGKEPPFLHLVTSGYAQAIMAGLILFLVVGMAVYGAGPRLAAVRLLRPLADRATLWLPWRRRRLQRDFTAMLALLLDAGAPEEQAVLDAARGTGNRIFVRRAQRVAAALRRGERLPDALQWLDDAGELHWRLTNAAHARGGFFSALTGWHDSLAAKAFQQEQAAAHIITSVLVVIYGAAAALVAIGVFQCLTVLMEEPTPW